MQGDLSALIERVGKCVEPDNALDVAIEVALFTPDQRHASARSNAAGTKVVYERREGGTDTYWAPDHTLNAGSREQARRALLRALSNGSKEGVA